ncbi:hypothetical protein LNKW23_43940 [Paralimibaculum aggregatum]|uniref:Uncharacterized protein n=1 Tax=Paralimibaculum aggregatum TaxID=3036245 RepID=A0ABQ6LSW5_9RHOB|nr:hypothetical protein [Limibaculum sp. NKW23]GMG85178.1 hypothetical protein LNKW23_43940 [Limibaculum sp. NKW23]
MRSSIVSRCAFWRSCGATVPQVFDLLADPQERCDIFMITFTESTWAVVPANEAVKEKMKTYITYPPRKLRSETYTGPIRPSRYRRFSWVREQLEKDGVNIGMPTGNLARIHHGRAPPRARPYRE